jgi:hypothetical protein
MKALASRLLALSAAIAIALQAAASVEAATRKMPQPPNPAFELPMRVVIVRNNIGSCEPLCPQWVSAEGRITADTPAVFKKALATAQKLRLPIVITSPGGDVDAALIIGEMIRARHLDVAVGSTYFGGCAPYQRDCKLPKEQNGVYRGIVLSGQGFCVSACPFILASGERRMRGTGALVGVHQISRTVTREKVRYFEEYRIVNGKRKILSRKVVGRKPVKSYVSTRLDKRLKGRLLAYFERMGVDKALLALCNRAPPSSMYMLASDEMRTTRLITDVTPAPDLVASGVCAREPAAANCVLLEAAAKP